MDIDGVLNGMVTYRDGHDALKTNGGVISKRCLEEFNQLVVDTGAKVVISSTWRTDNDIEDYLREAGLKAEIIGKTPVITSRFSLRGNEIHAWIVENEKLLCKNYAEFNSFVILDDDSDMLWWHRNNFFQTDTYCGLTPNVAYRAKLFLNSFEGVTA